MEPHQFLHQQIDYNLNKNKIEQDGSYKRLFQMIIGSHQFTSKL